VTTLRQKNVVVISFVIFIFLKRLFKIDANSLQNLKININFVRKFGHEYFFNINDFVHG